MDSIDAIAGVDMTGDQFIYIYEDSPRGWIKVGWTGDYVRRSKTHKRDGKELLAVFPGTWEDEKHRLHPALAPWRIEGRDEEYHQADELYEWVETLLLRNYAAPTFEQAKELAHLPADIWLPGRVSRPADVSGQTSLFMAYSPRDRARRAAADYINASYSDEWYTDPAVLDAAREAMGGAIDTDPASCAEANRNVKAKVWYGRQQNGLDPAHPWTGNVWLNPPYGRGDASAGAFIDRLVRELQADVAAAITCLNLNSMSSNWFRPVAKTAAAHCISSPRIRYVAPGGENQGSPTKGTVLSYFGSDVDLFCSSFRQFGFILLPENA